jgi:adenine-specific DNA-methyltransferase
VDKLTLHSPDLTQSNIDKIAELFPTVVTETKDPEGNVVRGIDFDLLRQELSDHVVEGPQERYQLEWPGKRQALFAANAPIAKTLRPRRKESVDFDTTKNLFIEGDNLEALKLLQESYFGKVKLIYIDPPYNTGNDFVYNDDFAETNAEYLAKSGQVDAEGNRLVANTESNGRFHSDWLSKMYPRLKLARNLLADDGTVFISIDDHEKDNLKKLCDHVFGETNYLNTFVWVSNLKGRQITGRGAAGTKEYVLCYGRKTGRVGEFRASAGLMKALMPSVYKGFNYTVLEDGRGSYVLKNELYNTNSIFNEATRPNLVYDIYFNPQNRDVITAPVSTSHLHDGYVKITPHLNNNGVNRYHAFRWSRKKVEAESDDLEFVESSDGYKVFTKVRDVDSTSTKDLIMDITTNSGSSDIQGTGLDPKLFNFPKPVDLIEMLCALNAEPDSTIVDFFAGSGTTAHAVMKLNARDGKNRRFVMVQLPETLEQDRSDTRAKYSTIAELSKERIRRAGKQILEGEVNKNWNQDIGFRVLKIDTSNMNDVLRTPDQVHQGELDIYTDSVKADRTGEDLLFQVLLDWGLELTMPIEVEEMAGQQVFVVEVDALIACFAEEVSAEVVSAIAERKPLRAVFRDSGFATDADRINAEQIFAERSPATDVKTV